MHPAPVSVCRMSGARSPRAPQDLAGQYPTLSAEGVVPFSPLAGPAYDMYSS